MSLVYHASVERDGRFWLIRVTEIDRVTQARSIEEIEPMVRDLIATHLDIEPDSFEVRLYDWLLDEPIPVAFTGRPYRCPDCGRRLVRRSGTGQIIDRGGVHGTAERPCTPTIQPDEETP